MPIDVAALCSTAPSISFFQGLCIVTERFLGELDRDFGGFEAQVL